MSHIINNILLLGNNLIPEMHFSQLEFTYSAHRTFIAKKNAYKNLKWHVWNVYLSMKL